MSKTQEDGIEKQNQEAVIVEKKGIFATIILFVNQVIDEMKKVVYPTKKETGTYVVVVIVFVTIIMFFITIIDFVVGSIVGSVFGG